jgi:hypothetical protein
MGNLRQSMTGEEWNDLESQSESNSEKRHLFNTLEVKAFIYQFCKDAMITNVPENDKWINNWIDLNIK